MNNVVGYDIVLASKEDFYEGALVLEWNTSNRGWLLQKIVKKHYNTVHLKVYQDYRQNPVRRADVTVTASIKEPFYILKKKMFDYAKSIEPTYQGHYESLDFDEWHNILLTQYRRRPVAPTQ